MTINTDKLDPLISKGIENLLNDLDTLKGLIILADIPNQKDYIDSVNAGITEIEILDSFYNIHR